MSSVPAGWYKDPADPSTQRYWDGDGWVGKAIPADAVPPDGPPPPEEPEPVVEPTPAVPETAAAPAYQQPGQPALPPGPPPGWAPQPPPPPGWQPPPGMQPPPGWQQPGSQPPPGWQPHPGAYPMHAYGYPVPEVRPHGMALAGLGQRLVARIIDILAVLLLNVVVNGYFVYLYLQDFTPIFRDYYDKVMAGETNPVIQQATPRMSTLSVAIVMIATLLWLLYEAPAISGSGQTLGKRLMRIKVVGIEKPGQIGFARAFTRWARLGMWTLFWWCGIGMLVQLLFALSPLFDPRLRQAWHDKAAGTVVVAVPAGAFPTVDAATRGDQPGGQ